MNFFIHSFNSAMENAGIAHGPYLNIILPLGISFFVFESLTYIIDVYRREQKALNNLSHYLLYIFFFPKMIAGPIVRYSEISDQIEGRFENNSIHHFLTGFGRFVTGLCKKVLIADVLGVYTDAYIRGSDHLYSIESAWLAAISFTMQIYFDFSGYSDMAIGIARMFGFKLNENFNNPFNSASLSEFWKRWHMSFTRWIKQYIYIPLGGNKKPTIIVLINLWVIFLISGLWHGAAWNYVIWGMLHGLVLTIEKLVKIKYWGKKFKWITIPITTIVIILLTLLLKTSDINSSILWYKSLFGITNGIEKLSMLNETKVALIIALVFSFISITKVGKKWEEYWFNYNEKKTLYIKPIAWVVMWVFALSYITGHKFTAFIYYMF